VPSDRCLCHVLHLWSDIVRDILWTHGSRFVRYQFGKVGGRGCV